jgi:hypothetical protein
MSLMAESGCLEQVIVELITPHLTTTNYQDPVWAVAPLIIIIIITSLLLLESVACVIR